MRKLLFYTFRLPNLASKINEKKKKVVFKPFLGPHLSHLFNTFPNTVDLGTPFKIQWAPKWDPKSIIFAKLTKSCMKLPPGGGFYS